MNIPCPQKIDCPDSEYPLSNYSSEDPDPPILIRLPADQGRVNFIGGGAGGPIKEPDGGPVSTPAAYASDLICVGENYSQSMQFLAVPPITFEVTSGVIPSWVLATVGTFDVSLTGTPSEFDVGDGAFTITATDANGAIFVKHFTVNVFGITTITPLPAATNNAAYSVQLDSGGGVPGYVYTLSGGSMPPGISLSPEGLISGTPVVGSTETFDFTIRVGDGLRRSCDKQMSIEVIAGCSGNPPIGLTWETNLFAAPPDSNASGAMSGVTQSGIFHADARSDAGLGLATSALVQILTTSNWTNPQPTCTLLNLRITWNFTCSDPSASMTIDVPFLHVYRNFNSNQTINWVVSTAQLAALGTQFAISVQCPDSSVTASASADVTIAITYV